MKTQGQHQISTPSSRRRAWRLGAFLLVIAAGALSDGSQTSPSTVQPTVDPSAGAPLGSILESTSGSTSPSLDPSLNEGLSDRLSEGPLSQDPTPDLRDDEYSQTLPPSPPSVDPYDPDLTSPDAPISRPPGLAVDPFPTLPPDSISGSTLPSENFELSPTPLPTATPSVFEPSPGESLDDQEP